MMKHPSPAQPRSCGSVIPTTEDQAGQHVIPVSLLILQLKILGPQYGMWGLRKYGTSLTLVDALVFWPDRLTCLADMIKIEQEKARKLAVPSAFVTFKLAAASRLCPAVLCSAASCCALLCQLQAVFCCVQCLALLCNVVLCCAVLCSSVPLCPSCLGCFHFTSSCYAVGLS